MLDNAEVGAIIKTKISKYDENNVFIGIEEKEIALSKEEVNKIWQSQMQH